MECSLCDRALSEPFNAQVFFADGTEEQSENRYYRDVQAVVIYSHKDCSESRSVLTRRRKGPRGPQMNPCDPLEIREAEEFVKENYKIVRKGRRFLMVLPNKNEFRV
jgi:hypothetical protein